MTVRYRKNGRPTGPKGSIGLQKDQNPRHCSRNMRARVSTDRVESLKRVRDRLISAIASVGILLLRRLDYRRASAWGARMGRLAYLVVGKNRKRASDNLTRVFGDGKTPEQRKEIVKALFENFSRSGFELVPYGLLSPEQRREHVQVVGKEKLDEALSVGRGVIAVSAHLGNFMIIMPRLAADGYHVDFIVKPLRNEIIEQRMQALREELGYHSIYVTPRIQSMKACLRSLKQNRVLVLYGDQRQRQGGIDVTFFGIPAKAAPGPIALALSTGAPVVPMFMVRNPDGFTHTLLIDDPLELVMTGSKEQDIKTNVQAYTDVIQSYIEQYPAHWAWDHKRWAR